MITVTWLSNIVWIDTSDDFLDQKHNEMVEIGM